MFEFYILRSHSQRKPPFHDFQSWFNKSIESCILSGDPECSMSPGIHHREQQLTFFCGNSPECRRIGSRRALMAAMENVEKWYSVVG